MVCENMKVKVVINGFGIIGKRVADAVKKQSDMELIGVVKAHQSYSANIANELGYPLYIASSTNKEDFLKAGSKIEGTLDDALQMADVVVDATPDKVGKANAEIYKKYKNLKAIWQGGEKADIAEVSFNAMANYEKALGKKYVRVVSCNTTALCRSIASIKEHYNIKEVNAVIVRRAADPSETTKGPINSLEPALHIPSHHGPDVRSVLPDVNIQTMAVKAPTTLMHIHSIIMKINENASVEEILKIFENAPRIRIFKENDKITGTAELIEYARDLGRTRGDLMENAVWKEGLNVVDKTIYYYQAVHQESIVVPENIDAIHAMFEMFKDKNSSIKSTDNTLGISKN